MARRPTLEVDGVKYDNVYNVQYEVKTAFDETGRPSDRAHGGLIKILRESDDKTDLARWAMDSSQPNWKSGKVTFRKHDDSVMKELTFEEAFVTKYEEVIPHTKNRPDDQVYEYLEISCHLMTIGDAQMDNRWIE